MNIPIAGTGNVTISISRTGDIGDIALAAQGLPAGITAAFDPVTVPSGTNSATVTLAIAPGTAAGTSNVTLVGTAGGLERTVAVAVTAQTITVSGTVRGGARGVTVRIPGKAAVTSGTGGVFSFADVSPPYDIYTVGQSGGLIGNPIPAITYYRGLTRPDPIVSVATPLSLIAISSAGATVSGTKSGGDGTTPMMIFWSNGGQLLEVAPSTYSVDARWSPAAATNAGVLFGLQFTRRPSGAPNTFPGFGSSGQVTLTQNTDATVNVTMTPPQTAVLTGSITAPAGFPAPTLQLNQQIGSRSLLLWTTSTTTADATIPVIAAGKSALFATASLNKSSTSFVDPGLNATKDVTFALPAPAIQLAPVDTATGVNTATVFSWSPAPATIYEINLSSSPARYIVITSEASTTIPVVPELPLPSNQSFTWQINGYGPKANINDAASEVGLETVFAADYDGERHSLTNSTDRAFTTAP